MLRTSMSCKYWNSRGLHTPRFVSAYAKYHMCYPAFARTPADLGIFFHIEYLWDEVMSLCCSSPQPHEALSFTHNG